jgi:hypothetical protein
MTLLPGDPASQGVGLGAEVYGRRRVRPSLVPADAAPTPPQPAKRCLVRYIARQCSQLLEANCTLT